MENKKINTREKPYPLLSTKLFMPQLQQGCVLRQALIDRLNKARHKRLTLISAPAGFGKTTLLLQWIFQNRIPAAWISLDTSDSDPASFLCYLIAALQKITEHTGDAVLSMMQSPHPPPFQTILIHLMDEISHINKDFILVMDDYHTIENPDIHTTVNFILAHLPPKMHVVISTRTDPPLPLARMTSRHQITEIRSSDLCFTLDETVSFFNETMNLNLSRDDISRLESRTEGWIAGLQLAGLSMQGREDLPDFIDAFAGDNRHIADYLVDEVLNLQPDPIQDFLLKTSILGRFKDELCDFITQGKDARKILGMLEASNLFIIPLDDRRGWYRYHQLFADLLRLKLDQTDKTLAPDLHKKASLWFEKNDYREEAIDHALAAKDYFSAANLIETFTEAVWQGGEQVTLFRWADQLPEEYILSRPNLCLFHARVLFESGHQDAAERKLSRLEKAEGLSCASTPAGIQGRIAAVKAYMAGRRGDTQGIVTYSQQALAALPEKDSVWRAIVAISSGLAHELAGDSTAAITAHTEAVAAARKAGNVYFYLITRLWLAIALKDVGRLPEAMEICRQLLDEVNEKKLSFNVAVGHAFGGWSEILYELNRLDEACDYSQKSIALMEQGHDVSHLGRRYSYLVKILCSKGNIAGAEKTVLKMEKLMQTSDMPPWTTTRIEAVKARIWLMKGNLAALEKWVTRCGLTLDRPPTLLKDDEYIMFARILVAQGRFNDAGAVLNQLLQMEARAGRILSQIEILLIKALALKKETKQTQSMAAVMKALSLAEPGGYIRIFADEGPPLAGLLEKLPDSGQTALGAFVKKVLSKCGSGKSPGTDPGLGEPLSRRELEVLRLIASGLSNNKIMETLFISLPTVKTHCRNLYVKLNVHSRTQAVSKARYLGLL